MCENKHYYHYCPAGTFKSIVENKTLRFSNAKKSNDKGEFDLTYSLIKKQFDEKGILLDYFIKPCDIYFLCYSSKRDSLNEWIKYGDNAQGFIIAFNKDRLEKFLSEKQLISIKTQKVIYINKDDETIKDEIEKYINYKDIDSIIEFCVKHKHIAFKSEEEIRSWFTFFTDSNFDKQAFKSQENINIQSCCENGLIKNYFDVSFENALDIIDEVIIGPCNSNTINDINTFLRCNNMLDDGVGVQVNKSFIPYVI